jgi:UTP:GlnB (protein PII) uridylyltransferase
MQMAQVKVDMFDPVDEFVTTLPERYLQQFDPDTIRQHARISGERGKRPAHAGLFRAGEGGPGLCVVATDGPGLLAAISASLMLEGFDITHAEAFTRWSPSTGYEAVDLFGVRRATPDRRGPLTALDVDAVRGTLLELLGKKGALGSRRLTQLAPTPGAAETSVRFLEHPSEARLTLELDTNDRAGLLMSVTDALFREGVQIVGSRIRTSGERVLDRFDLVEVDGSRISGTRLQRIQLAVLSAVDAPSGFVRRESA